MTSTIIYQPIVPTYLYIKQHSVTQKKYFGKTTRDPYKYNGSGEYWAKHIKKHGKKHIETLWVSDLYYDTSIVDVALKFSFDNNIVESKEWANMKPENGLDGWVPGDPRKPNDTSFKKGHIPWSKNKKMPSVSEHKKSFWRNWHKTHTKKPKYIKKGISDTTRALYSTKMTKQNTEILVCPFCDVKGQGYANMHRWHFEKCTKNPNNTTEYIQCPFCIVKSRSKSNMHRYHFDKCKQRPTND